MAHLIIVGAGPGGAMLAFLLARAGVQVTLIERSRDFAREFRGEGLQASGVDVFRQAGLEGHFGALPQTWVREVEFYRGPRRLFRVRLADLLPGFDAVRWVSQPAMLEMLVEEAGRFPGFRLERGISIGGLLTEKGRIVGVRGSGEGREFRGDFVVGADGRFSVLRVRAGLHEEHNPQVFDLIWCKVPQPPFLTAQSPARGYLGDGHLGIFIPAYDGQLQVGWIIAKGSFGELRARGIAEWLDEVAAHVSDDLAQHLRAHRAAASHPFLLDVISDRLVRWTQPGLLLIGDAAHPMSPVGGQGINIALRDAVVAANHLGPVLLGDGSPEELDAAAARVQAERLSETLAIQDLQQTPPGLLFIRGWRSRLVVDVLGPYVLPWLVPILTRTGLAEHLLAANLRRFATGVTEVRLDDVLRSPPSHRTVE